MPARSQSLLAEAKATLSKEVEEYVMNEYNHSKEMPRFPEPYWRDSEHIRSFPQLNESIHVDAAVVGAGISGITTAYLLAREGLTLPSMKLKSWRMMKVQLSV